MTTAFYPGSFDPLTRGHQELIEYAVEHDIGHDVGRTGKLIVVVGSNAAKKEGLFDKDVRKRLIRLGLDKKVLPFVEITEADAATEAEVFARYRPEKILRGIRNEADAKDELALSERWHRVHAEVLGPHARTVWHSAPAHLKNMNATEARKAIRGENGRDLKDLSRLLPAPCAKLLTDILTRHPEARQNRELLNRLTREALDALDNVKTGTPAAWDAIAADCRSKKPYQEGQSKQMWLLTPAMLARHGIACDKPVFLTRLKPTVYSYTNERDEVIEGTERLRLRATEIMWGWLKEAGIDVPVHHVGKDFYVIDVVGDPNIEVVGKAAHVGTPKHRLYGTGAHKTRTGKAIVSDEAHEPYIRFDWRNPKNHPESGKPLADECIPTDLADRYIDARVAQRTADNAFRLLRAKLGALGVELQDICFFISRDGLSVFSEVSPDGLRAKWAGSDLDKDAFRKGRDAESVINAYALLVGLIEGEPRPGSRATRDGLLKRVRDRYGVPAPSPKS